MIGRYMARVAVLDDWQGVARSSADWSLLQARGEVVTGLLFVEAEVNDLHAHLNTVDAPLNTLREAELCPGSAMLGRINASLR